MHASRRSGDVGLGLEWRPARALGVSARVGFTDALVAGPPPDTSSTVYYALPGGARWFGAGVDLTWRFGWAR